MNDMTRVARACTGLLLLPAACVFSAGAFPEAVRAASTDMARSARERLPALQKEDALSSLFSSIVEAVGPAVVEVRVAERVKVEEMPDVEEVYREGEKIVVALVTSDEIDLDVSADS